MIKKTSIRISLGIGLIALILLPTLTSCSAQATQYYMPITVANPFNNIASSNQTDGQKLLHKKDGNQINAYDKDSYTQDQFAKYLPKKYIFQKTDASNYFNSFAYASMQNVNDIANTTVDSVKDDDITLYEPKWQNTFVRNEDLNNSHMNWLHEKNIYSLRNYNIQQLSSYGISNIAKTIAADIQSLWSFISQPGIIFGEHQKEWFEKFANWNILSDGLKDQNNSHHFYEFLFDLNNVARSGNSQLYFDVSDIDFSFASNLFGPGPLITDTSDINFDGASPASGYDLIKQCGDFKKSVGDVPNWNSDYAIVTKIDDGNRLDGFRPVPILIHPKNIKFSYYNSRNVNSFFNSEWKNNNLNDIKNQISKNHSWENIYKKTGTRDINSNVQNTSFNLKFSDEKIASINSTYLDFGMKKILDGNIAHNNDFIALANYVPYRFSENKGNDYDNVIPLFSSITSIYPITLLFDDTGGIDTNVFDKRIVEATEVPTNAPEQDLPSVHTNGAHFKIGDTIKSTNEEHFLTCVGIKDNKPIWDKKNSELNWVEKNKFKIYLSANNMYEKFNNTFVKKYTKVVKTTEAPLTEELYWTKYFSNFFVNAANNFTDKIIKGEK